MERLNFRFEASLAFSAPVTEHQFVLRCIPAKTPGQRILQLRTVVAPHTEVYEGRDGFGNITLSGSLRTGHTELHYEATGIAELSAARHSAAAPAPMYRYPSALTLPDEALLRFYESVPLRGKAAPQKLKLLCEAVHESMAYRPGSTTFATTAAKSFAQGCGVCQDFTQVFLALARLAGFSARYCMGLALGEGATHAWAEVYLQGGWIGVDPTRGCAVGKGYLLFAVGRDAADCPAERGVFFGAAAQTQQVNMRLLKAEL